MRSPGWLLAVLPALLATCEQPASGPDPNYSEPMVNAILYRVELYDGDQAFDRDVEVSDSRGLRMVPVVTLNTRELRPYFYGSTLYRYGDTLPFQVNWPYELEVEHYWGRAFSRVAMPGNFDVVTPPENYIFDLESTLVISWTPSAGVQWYWVDLYCDYDFLDWNQQWNDFEFDFDTLVTDTFLVIPPGKVFPGYVEEVLEGDASAYVLAGYGPPGEPGDRGNVRGAGFGFFSAGNEPLEKYFYVGAPPVDGPTARRERHTAKLAARLAARGDR